MQKYVALVIAFDTHFWFEKDENGECLKLFERLEQESLHRSIGYINNVQSILSSVLVELVRNYTGYAPFTGERHSAPDSKRMLIIDNCFLSQYATITEEKLSRILNLSIRQLQRFLKEYYGKTFVQMRQTARLNKAAELLKKAFLRKKPPRWWAMTIQLTLNDYTAVSHTSRQAPSPFLMVMWGQPSSRKASPSFR